jgi:hypothetical protein
VADNGFVSLNAIRKGTPTPEEALAEIRRLYFRTSKQTIAGDLGRAIELLRAIADEEIRDKAAVFMDGLQQMQNEWQAQERRKKPRDSGTRPPRKKG